MSKVRLLGEIGLAAALGWYAFTALSTDSAHIGRTKLAKHKSETGQTLSATNIERQVPRTVALRQSTIAADGQQFKSSRTGEDIEARLAIKSAVMNQTARSASSRDVDTRACFSGVELAGPQRIRFEIAVSATVSEIRTGHWQFGEVVDGQVLPESVLTCLVTSFGGNYIIYPGEGESFPVFDGTIATVYRTD